MLAQIVVKALKITMLPRGHQLAFFQNLKKSYHFFQENKKCFGAVVN
jgi:hypothetical protein